MSPNSLPYTVPIGLTAKEYYDLGIRYKLAGWIQQSKKSLRTAMLLDPEGVGKRAGTYLKAYLPRNEVPEEAIVENIKAVNLSMQDKKSAEKALLELTKRYPNFEWPFGNLGHQYIEEGRLPEAKESLLKALAINPNYVSALVHMAALNLKESKEQESDKYLAEILKLDPEYKSNVLDNYPALKERLKELAP
ncbi:MAG: hypothetical protein HY986_12750 [Candidatus Melainabacteria bacterium]|nr:hypothetical protein [Candidatus Melainabacteria bacterium]